jgi:hypothetical protein
MAGVQGSLMTISAGNGFHYSTSTSEITEKHVGVVVVGDSVISAWTAVDGAKTVNLLTRFNLATVTITSDFPPLIIPGNMTSSSITFSTNGGVCLLRG